MKKNIILKLQDDFNAISSILEDANIEYWYARDLQKVLDYSEWRNFNKVIDKAKISCKVAKIDASLHFVDINKKVDLGLDKERNIKDIMLTRYACYLIAQNGDSSKESIAFAQTYFAIQTRKQELLEQRIELEDRLKARAKLTNSETELSKNIFERGVDSKGFGIIRSKGDHALFGGFNTQNMKDKLNVPNNRPLADFLPTVTITAKNLATEITNHNTKQNNLQGQDSITQEHITNNTNVRKLLDDSGIKPEELPASKDLKKLEREVKSNEKKMIKDSQFPKKLKDNDCE
ncbi:MAG: DNA damage-inducible protein D [Epsilonproteobacteria bacterium]|nr:MAG: DNA damage-inducible protein D [Campylobacterota bacterium]